MSTSTTHAHEDALVVFNIGMTIRAKHRPDLWLPVFRAMPRMLRELHDNRARAERGEADDLGFLGHELLVGGKGPWVVQYWRSTKQLYAYATDSTREHLPAWRAFNSAARRHPGAVGIWHETFAVPRGGVETVYAGGAHLGLGAATGMVAIGRRGRHAQQRLGGALSA